MSEYKGSIELISGLTQKNNGNFPLVDASAIQVDETDKRLDIKLTELDDAIESSSTSVSIDNDGNAVFNTVGFIETNLETRVNNIDDDLSMIKSRVDNLPTLTEGDNIKIENGVISVLTTNEAEQDNTRPLTSAGAYVIIGNIEALLSQI